jgi:hypothetical protein
VNTARKLESLEVRPADVPTNRSFERRSQALLNIRTLVAFLQVRPKVKVLHTRAGHSKPPALSCTLDLAYNLPHVSR